MQLMAICLVIFAVHGQRSILPENPPIFSWGLANPAKMHVKIEAVSNVPATTLNRPATVFAVLSLIAIAGFAGVTRLANRYQEQQKALARRLFARGVENQKDSRFDRAIEDFRAALTYDHDNSQYQLSLARALRDTGRTSEA